jgi:potassium-transporting ATPase KdpC subunit
MSPVATPPPERRRPPAAHSLAGHARAAGIFLVAMIFVAGFAYPLVVTEIAQLIDPHAANGSLLYHNGTLAGSSLVAQNTDAPYLFWERYSPTDYNNTLGAPTPPGPTQPQLAALIGETLNYTRLYGNLSPNASLPFEWVSPSGSSVDPDLIPDAVLIQVPRVAAATNLSISFLQGFVNKHIVNPMIPFLGVPYVDVLQLDLALLPLIGK